MAITHELQVECTSLGITQLDGQTRRKMFKSTQFLTVDVEHEDDIGNISPPKLDSWISRKNKADDGNQKHQTTQLLFFFWVFNGQTHMAHGDVTDHCSSRWNREWWYRTTCDYLGGQWNDGNSWKFYFGKMMVPSFLEQNWLKEKWKWNPQQIWVHAIRNAIRNLVFEHLRCRSVWGWKHRLGMGRNFTDLSMAKVRCEFQIIQTYFLKALFTSTTLHNYTVPACTSQILWG